MIKYICDKCNKEVNSLDNLHETTYTTLAPAERHTAQLCDNCHTELKNKRFLAQCSVDITFFKKQKE